MKKDFLSPKLNLRIGTLALVMLAMMVERSLYADTLVQDFYIPMPEAQIYQANSAIISGTDSNMLSTLSILVTTAGTHIYYDQWEDGYETAFAQPAQSTTQVWGDGNDANGVPPGFTHDPAVLAVGMVITLSNSVAYPRNPATVLWDGGDHIAATAPLMVTRAAWPVKTGPVFAGAASILPTSDYGTNFLSPLGQDITNNLTKYVGIFIMAAQNNTLVTIDTNGTGANLINLVLNQGQSYLVNGGIKKGARVTSSQPVQAELIIGHVGVAYASDWFTLYPVSKWGNSYNTAVGSGTKGQPAYVYLFNPNTNALTIVCATKTGNSTVTIPGTNGVYQFQMPVASGGSFTSTNGQNFFAVCTVAALPSNDTAWNWGFTLVPGGALTTETDIGWGPGSSDGTVNGSPAWVTPLGNTKIYVRYRTGAGLLTDPNGNVYDTNFTATALQSLKVYDPSKNQTGMRLYTVDGTLLTGAWGEDPDVAGAGNPYIDAGTTALPLAMPVLRKSAVILTNAANGGLGAGATVQYSVTLANLGVVPLQNAIIIDTPAATATYLTNSTTLNGVAIPDASNHTFPLSAPGYLFPVVLSQATNTFTYKFYVNSVPSGALSNSVTVSGTSIKANCVLTAPPVAGASCSILFTTANGTASPTYLPGALVYLTMTNQVAATPTNQINTINVTVYDTTNGDYETITLTETGLNTGIFRNIVGLPTSLTSGISPLDGTLRVASGDTLSVAYTDPTFGNSCIATAVIQAAVPQKQLYLTLNGSTNGTQALNRIDPVANNHGPAASSIDIGPNVVSLAVTNTYTVGLASSAYNQTSGTNSSLTISNVTTTSGTNRLMIVGVSFSNPGRNITGGAVTNVLYGTNILRRLTNCFATTYVQSEIWYLTNPPTGVTNVVVQMTNNTMEMVAGVLTMTNVDLSSTSPFFAVATNATTTSTAAATVAVSAMTNQLVFQVAGWDFSSGGATTAYTVANSAGQTLNWFTNFYDVSSAKYMFSAGGDVRSGPASTTAIRTTNSLTLSSARRFATIGISVKGSPTGVVIGGGGSSGPATNVAVFAQTPAFVQPFTILSNNLVTVTNYITVTNGLASLTTTNPLIKIWLLTNGVSFMQMSNAIYGSDTFGRKLSWSGKLNGNVTIPAGAAISYLISNGVSGLAFHINYDATNAPSKISFPTTSVITISNLAIYSAAYPGGSPVSTTTAGTPLYVRATVSDPFGNYDITSLGLNVTTPDTNFNQSPLLTPNAVVSSGTTNYEVFQYLLATAPAPGNYSVVATANEGTEGVTANALASLNTVVLDLGTPATTSFTATNNGITTNSYPANATAWIMVSDSGANTNANMTQTISATVTSTSGDLEIIPLTETGTNTGVFTGGLLTATNSGTGNNNSLLIAPVSAVLTVTYSNAIGVTTANATIQPPPGAPAAPNVVIYNTITYPGSQLLRGQTVTHNLQVINVGNTNLPNLSISDVFPTNMTFASAGFAYNTAATNAGKVTLTWTNLGALTLGQSTNLTVNFTAAAIGSITNVATANAITATNNATALAAVYNPGVTVTKTLFSPTNQPVAVGSNLVFQIVVANTGNTAINYLPMEDNFSGSYYQYVSATISANSSGYGSLVWTNLVGVGQLAAGTSLTNKVTMKVVGQGSPANNTAVADFAADVYSNSVPAASGQVGVTTSAASIAGGVYNDVAQSGIYQTNAAGLSGVTLQLITGTNNTLVAQTTSGANGQFQFLNLNVGNYVVVATPLTGFASSAPVNNQTSVSVTNLTAVTNVNFLEYQPAVSAYSTIGGKVWSDANDNGTNDVGEAGAYNVTVNLVQDLNTNGVADAGEPVAGSTSTDTNGVFTFLNVTPGNYVLSAPLPAGYYITGNSQGRVDGQISFLAPTNGIVATNFGFYLRALPFAENDTVSALYLLSSTLTPTTNDTSPYSDALVITNATSTNGNVTISGTTNLLFTPTNLGVAFITYALVDAHGGVSSNATITVNLTTLADLAVGLNAATSVGATSNLVYTVSVTNYGPTFASNAIVTETLPPGTTFVSASVGSTNAAGIVTLNLENLAINGTTNVTFTLTVPADGPLTNSVSVSAFSPDSNLSNNTSSLVITAIQPYADVAITGTAAATAIAPTNLIYTFIITNAGPSIAGGLVVTDSLPANVTFVSASSGGTTNNGVVTWSLGNLPAGTAINITLTVLAATPGGITNFVAVTTSATDVRQTNNVTALIITTVATSADVCVTATGPAATLSNDNVVYNLTVSNAGPSVALNVILTNTLPANTTFVSANNGGDTNLTGKIIWNLGDLAAGAASNVTLTVQAPVSGSITNVAATGSSTSDANLTNNSSAAVITSITTTVADLVAFISAPATVSATSNFVYTITVTNLGPSSATSLALTDALPASVTFVSASGGGVNASGTVSWNLSDLAADATTNLTLTVKAPANGSVTNTATATSSMLDPYPANNTPAAAPTSVIGIADVGVTESAASSVIATSNLVYSISVTNLGPSTATSLIVTDTLPANVTFVSATGNGIYNNGSVIWNFSSLASGTGTNITVTVAAPVSGSLTNNVSVGSAVNDLNLGNNSANSVNTSVTGLADIAVGQIAPANVYATSNFLYTISVTNFGPSGASNLSVTDALPAGVNFISASGSGNTNSSGAVVWSIGSLPSDGVTNLTLTATAPISGTLSNAVTAFATTSDPNIANNTAAAGFTVLIGVVDLSLNLAVPASVPALGTFNYTLTVTNLGPSTASAVFVTNGLPDAATYVSDDFGGTLSADGNSLLWFVGDMTTGAVVTINVTLSAPADGVLTNVAGVTSASFDASLEDTVVSATTLVTGVADVGLDASVAPTVYATSNFVYTIAVTNFGPSIASSVAVTNVLPSNATFVSADSGGANNGGTVVWNLGDLPNGAVTNITLTVAAPVSGSLTNTFTAGTAADDQVPDNNISSTLVTTVIPLADVAISASAAAKVVVTSNLVYTISVTNFGPSAASAVVVTDALPAQVTFVSADGGGNLQSGIVTWTLGTLSSGGTTNLHVTVNVPATDCTAITLTNRLTANSAVLDPAAANNATVVLVSEIALTNYWSSGGSLSVNLFDAQGVAGSGFSQVNYTGKLNVTAAATNPFVIRVTTPTGAAANFNNASNYSWTIATTTCGIVNFAANQFSVDASGVTNNLAGGYFTVTLSADSNAVILKFIGNLPPVANPIVLYRATGNSLKIFISDILTNYTTDPNGDLRVFLGVGASTNGAYISTNSALILFAPTNNITESFTYRIRDARPYRPGDTVYTATNLITVIVSNYVGYAQSVLNATPSSVSVRFAGIPGYAYDIQRNTNLSVGSWQTIAVTNAPPGGVWIFTDTNPPQPSGFYRTAQH